ncbi:hypothetical protein pb186bvf_013336 [Paramecium bursaria]
MFQPKNVANEKVTIIESYGNRIYNIIQTYKKGCDEQGSQNSSALEIGKMTKMMSIIFQFIIGALLLKKAPKIKNKITLNTPLPQVMEKSIILLGITMSICVLFTQIIYQYGVRNELRLSTSAQYSGKLLQKPCFKSNGILKALTMIKQQIKIALMTSVCLS